MRKFIFVVLLFFSVLIVWYIYANIVNPASTSALLKNPRVITGKTETAINFRYPSLTSIITKEVVET